jgi:hypothetical protein
MIGYDLLGIGTTLPHKGVSDGMGMNWGEFR